MENERDITKKVPEGAMRRTTSSSSSFKNRLAPIPFRATGSKSGNLQRRACRRFQTATWLCCQTSIPGMTSGTSLCMRGAGAPLRHRLMK